MIRTTTNTIECWRGDNVASKYTLTLISTATLKEYEVKSLADKTPTNVVITLTIPTATWSSLPYGEYTYTISDGNTIIARGIFVKEGADVTYNEHNREKRYVEYKR